MSDRPAKPPHAPRLSPYLTVRDPDAALAFYQKAFGFSVNETTLMKGPDGQILHGEMNFHDATIMLAPEGAWGGTCQAPASSGTEVPIGLYLYCDDPDAIHTRAVAAGATSACEPQDMFWGDRMCSLVDLDGYKWSFARNVGDFDPAKMPPVG